MKPASFFVIRTPLMPLDTLSQLSEGLEAPTVLADPDQLRDAWSRDRARVHARLQALLREPVVREAVFIASPDLEHAIERWLTDSEDPKADTTARAVLRYVTRMASRSTPFGLFAGNGVGALGETTRLAVSDRASCRRHTRLDMDYLALLTGTLARDPALASVVRYLPNSGLYRAGDRWRLVETRMQDRNRSQHLVAVDDSEAITSTIERARTGASRATLATALVGDDITADEADAFIGELIETQMLVPDIDCPITGREPLAHLVDLFKRAPEGERVAHVLEHVRVALVDLDAGGLGASPGHYRRIAQQLEELPAKVDIARLFQIDLVRPAVGATIDRTLVNEIIDAVDIVCRLSPGANYDELARFRAAFSDRYERREVPLVEALDEEAGVGSALLEGAHRDPSPLLRELDFPSPPTSTVPWSQRETFLLRRVGETLIAAQQELALTRRDIDELTSGTVPTLPDACSVMATVIPPSVGDTGSESRVLLQSVSGPSGAKLLGRFCHADPELLANVATHLREEEALDTDAIFAEVVHLPEGRLGNILLRPVLRDYEIPYLGVSGAPPERQIPTTDLTIHLSNGRFVLRSRRLGRRIVPRLTSAHNFTARTLNVYRFLCLLQSEGRMHSWTWNWGALADLPFLPRVTYGRLVLARAAWRLTRDDIDALTREKTGPARYGEVQRWRTARRMPRWVVLADYDNTLPVDLDNAVAVESLIQLLKNGKGATLTEMYPGADELCAEGNDGRYIHELLIPFISRANQREPESLPAHRSRPVSIQRTFAPGSEWVFAKLYTSAPVSDRLLTQIIGPVSERLRSKGLIDRWFFIRYADPDEHLRWRLHVAGKTRPATVQRHVERAVAALLSDGVVRRLTFDTYEREIERYGGDAGITVAEHYSWADSEAIVQLLDPENGVGPGLDVRWQCAIAGVDALLSDFDFDLPARLRLMRRLRDVFGREFHADAAFARQLATKYRSVKPDLERVLSSEPNAPVPGLDAFASRSARVREALVKLRDAENAGLLSVPIDTLAESYVHMHLNRLFRAEQRAHELVIYDFLACLYESRMARHQASEKSS